MEGIVFTDPAVAEKYSTDQTHDKEHHLPGGTAGNGWRGKLSEIPLDAADRLYAMKGQNLLKLKDTAAVAGKGKGKTDNTDK